MPTMTFESFSTAFKEPGSFLRPTLAYDGAKVLFAWCRYYAHLAAEPNKLDKANVPEDAFYHLFEMNLDGSDVRLVSTGQGRTTCSFFFPDGKRFVYAGEFNAAGLGEGVNLDGSGMTPPDFSSTFSQMRSTDALTTRR